MPEILKTIYSPTGKSLQTSHANAMDKIIHDGWSWNPPVIVAPPAEASAEEAQDTQENSAPDGAGAPVEPEAPEAVQDAPAPAADEAPAAPAETPAEAAPEAPAKPTAEAVDAMARAELLALAKAHNITINTRHGEDKIREAIKAALAA